MRNIWPVSALMLASIYVDSAALAATASSNTPANIDIEVSPQWADGKFSSVDFSLSFQGEADGTTHIELPDQFTTHTELWRALRDIRFDNATQPSKDASATIDIQHEPSARVTMHYRVVSDDNAGTYRYGNDFRPVIDDTGFAMVGAVVLPIPSSLEQHTGLVNLTMKPPAGSPSSYVYFTNHGMKSSLADYDTGLIFCGGDWDMRDDGKGFKLASRKGLKMDVDGIFKEASTIYSGYSQYWGTHDDYLAVISAPSKPYPRPDNIGGMAITNGHLLVAQQTSAAAAIETLSHEIGHHWVPFKIGGTDQSKDNPDLWLSEGLTEWTMLRTSARLPGAKPGPIIDALNTRIDRYDSSSARSIPETGGLGGHFSNPEAQYIPYGRGLMFFTRLDDVLRSHSKGKVDLDHVLLRMLELARANETAGSAKVNDAVALLKLVVKELAPAVNIDADVQKYAQEAATIELAPDTYKPCGPIKDAARPAWVRGFDLDATMKAKSIAGVVEDGPAWKAGLRDGMRIAGFGEYRGDTSKPVSVTVMKEDHSLQRFEWLPVDGTQQAIHRLVAPETFSAEASDACVRALAGN